MLKDQDLDRNRLIYLYRKHIAVFLGFVLVTAFPAIAQNDAQPQSTTDIRALAVDIHLSLNRENTPEAIAFKLTQALQRFRADCPEVTDFQIYSRSQNLTDLKVKCTAAPLYGLSVGSNGYIAVYGGNGIIAGLDRRDGVIYSFGIDGELELTDGITIDNIIDETTARLQSGDEFSPIYILLFVVILLTVIVLMIAISLGIWRGRSSRLDADTQILNRRISKATKDQLAEESKKVSKNIFKHPSGTYIVRGQSGHRRFFPSIIWAIAYRSFNVRIFEVSAPTLISTESEPEG